MPTRNLTAELPVVLDVLSDDLENCFLFVEEGENFLFWLLQHPHFVGEISNQHPHFFHDVAQAEARWYTESRKQKKTQVPTTKINSFSPVGLQFSSKTSANTTDEQRYAL